MSAASRSLDEFGSPLRTCGRHFVTAAAFSLAINLLYSRRLVVVDRADLIALARDGSAAHRLARRANALVLLDSGFSCEKVAKTLFLDDDTIRQWHGLFIEDGFEGLTRFEAGGSACQLSGEQQEKLKAWVAAALPRTTRQIGAWIE
jgi:hypothetical protein